MPTTNKAYTTIELVRAFLNESITEVDEDITKYILAVQLFIEKYTQRNFKADSDNVERLFNGNSSRILLIDDCVSISKVELANDFYGSSRTEIGKYSPGNSTDAYITYPENHVEKVKPIRKLVLFNRFWTSGFKNHAITGKWGFSAIAPEDIQYVATRLVAEMYKKGRSGGVGGLKSEKIGQYSVSFDIAIRQFITAEIASILNSYKKFVI